MPAIDLDEQAARDPASVGHKAANLARFAASFRVPPAFCLTTSVYDELRGALEGDAEARRALRHLVGEAYARLAMAIGDGAPRVAVRSSATGEDSADASFAGQHETILNVAGVDEITDAVLECWASAGNERVSAYRRQKGIDAAVRVAVLVQQMVDAEVSAIAFGIDPVSGDHEVVVIDAAPGLGDKIASGEITPDRYVVRKGDLAVDGPASGALDEAQAREVARLTLALERENGHPVDVECAFSRGDLYLLQCRPITTMTEDFPVEWREPGDETLHWRRDDAHFAGPITHLQQEFIRNAAAHGMRARNEHFGIPVRPRFEPFNGRPYVTQQPLEEGERLQQRMAAIGPMLRAHSRALARLWHEEYLPTIRTHFAWMRAQPIEEMTLEELADVWDAFWPRVNQIWVIHMMTTGGSYLIMDELATVYEGLGLGPALDAFKLVQGRAASLQELERDLGRLARVRANGRAAAFSIAQAEFLEAHGNLGHAGEDMRHLPWSDDPESLVAELDRRAANEREDADLRHARLLAESDALAARAREQLQGRPADLARLDEVLAAARAAGPLTEEHNYHLDRQVQSNAARVFVGLGRRLARERLIADADDIFFLRIHEVRAALREHRDQRSLVTARRAEYARWCRLRAPKTIGAPAPAVQISAIASRADLMLRTAQSGGDRIQGVPASSGLRRGPARIVRGTADFSKMTKGDVLVCRSSNVSWIPLFTLAGAVVSDIGGALSHAAVVAREFGVPAVVGCNVAMERLRDGQLVEVDGDRGYVRPLD
jgi:phosphohistidine swiveling domain-containing protein